MLKFELSNLAALKQVYDPALVEKALVHSINRVSAKARTLVSREVRREYTIKARDINKALTLYRARRGNTEALLLYAGARIGLHKFMPRVRTVRTRTRHWGNTRKQVRVRVHQGGPLAPVKAAKDIEGFLSPEGLIFARVGLKRHPLKFMAGPAIAQMVDKDTVLDRV
ncbi:MAG: phage tail protein, partial [Litorivicinus sp.]